MIPQSDPRAGYLSAKKEIDEAIHRCMDSGWYVLGNEVSSFETEFAASMESRGCVGVANGTDAIELSLRALGIGVGDLVVTVSHTAVATAAAIMRCGAIPLFVDIDPERFTMDPRALRAALEGLQGDRVKAIVAVHLYGQPADMASIMSIAESREIPVVEDCAQSHGARIGNTTVGNWGALATYSFYPTKNLAALGDGGAVMGNDPDLLERVRELRQYGWKRRYISDSLGFNSRLDELQAAVLRVKLKALSVNNVRRRAIAAAYDAALRPLETLAPSSAVGCTHVYHQYVVRSERRDDLKEALARKGIATLVHYPEPVHLQAAFAGRTCVLPATEALCRRILSIPMFPELADEQVAHICTALGEVG